MKRRSPPRKVEPEILPQVRPREIPAWVSEIDAPPGLDLPAFFTQGRVTNMFLVPEYDDYLARLAARAELGVRTEPQGGRYLVELMDLVPWFWQQTARYPWLLDAQQQFYTYRAYDLLDSLPCRRRRPPTADRQRTLTLYRLARNEGASHDEALAQVAKLRSVTPEAVERAVSRARSEPLWGTLHQQSAEKKRRATKKVKEPRPAEPVRGTRKASHAEQ